MTMEDISVGKTELGRLGFTADKKVNDMPASCRNAPPIQNQSENKGLSGAGTTGIRRQVNATPTSRQLMRQMSGLGMEDPIFKATEAELTPAHPSNIFDDRSLGDIAEDMKDMISIASDPTAAGGDGLDVDMFHASMGCLNASISDFSSFKLSLHSKDTTKSNLGVLSPPVSGAPTCDKPVLPADSTSLLCLTDSLNKLPVETNLAKLKVSSGEECGKTSRKKSPAQRPRPPMEYIKEGDGVAPLDFESIVHLARLEKNQQHKAEEQKRLEKKERKQKRLDTLEKLEIMCNAKMSSHHKSRPSRTSSSSSKSSRLPEPKSPRTSNTDNLLLGSPKALETEDNATSYIGNLIATALIKIPTCPKQQEHEQSKSKILSHRRSRSSRTSSSSSKSKRLPEPPAPNVSNTDNHLLGSPKAVETQDLIATALIQSSTCPTQPEHEQSKPKISSPRKSRSSRTSSSRLNESQSSRRSPTSSILVGAPKATETQGNEISWSRTPSSSSRRAEGLARRQAPSPRSSNKDNTFVGAVKATETQGKAIACSRDLIATALSQSPTKSTQKEHERHLTLPPVTSVLTVQNDDSSQSSRSTRNRRSTSRTPSNRHRRSTSMTPGDQGSAGRTPSKQRSTSRRPSSRSRPGEDSADRESQTPLACNTDNNLVGAVKAAETQGNAISCSTDLVATAQSQSPTSPTQKKREKHLSMPPVTNLLTVQNDDSSKRKISRSSSNRRSTSRTPSNRRSTSTTRSNRRSMSRTRSNRRSTSRTPSSSRGQAEGSTGRTRCSEKDAQAT
jgi:hypothetical protein